MDLEEAEINVIAQLDILHVANEGGNTGMIGHPVIVDNKANLGTHLGFHIEGGQWAVLQIIEPASLPNQQSPISLQRLRRPSNAPLPH